MITREISLYILLGHLIIVGVASNCVSVHCLRCNATGETADSCQLCLKTKCINDTLYANNSSNCEKAFQVSINSTGSDANEGDDITLTCVHNVPNLNLTIGWTKDGEEMKESKNMSILVLSKVLSSKGGQYICYVNSSCGNYESSPEKVIVKNNNVFTLVICGVAALVLVLIMGLLMKFKLKRDNAKTKARMAQRALDGRAGGPVPFTPRES
ncbi:uncharacterized protein LOC130173666 [Seriola aureovittata]|uniref:uncharacterized protein LOC130173666 n=1 Tax=Seriola aureovittata TaxID=2871759 RepID=UPI0024BE52F0|nr:uncharacterized protein LOC130173666 [Seriola aureovittata]